MATKNNARMTDTDLQITAGIDPRTGLPTRVASSAKAELKPNVRKLLRIVDEQDAINRYTWYNLPKGLTPHLIERVLYYKGQGAFFYMPTNEKFYFLPYALAGGLDVYGRFTAITPLPFNGTTGKGDKENPWIDGLNFTPEYDIILPEDLTIADLETKCVLLHDYSNQISQTNIPRQQLQDPLLDLMSDCLPFMRTALLNNTGVTGVRVNGQDGAANVIAASKAIDCAALIGEKYVPIVDAIEMQDLTGTTAAKSEEFLLSLQALDNFRLSMYGLENGGLFQKKSHMLEAEQKMNNGNVGLIMEDGLINRQEFCNIINSIWGLGIWCEVSETITNLDTDSDATIGGDTTPNTEAPAANNEVKEETEDVE